MTVPDRRTVLRGAGVVGAAVVGAPLLAACGSDEGATTAPQTTAPSPTETGGADEGVTVAAASVAVGSGVVQDGVVVTQPTEGEFRAFGAACPHQGCDVGSVADNVISCPCHGSTFSAEDGARLGGPAQTGLSTRTATVEGDTVVVT